jgi:predicted phosphodiesterase
MRTALLADIHGNAVALAAVLVELQDEPVDQIICLGDVAQGGPQPAEAVDRLRDVRCETVLGNADAFLIDPAAVAEAPSPMQLRVREWTNDRLGSDRLAAIARYPPTVEASFGQRSTLLAFHGSPTSYDDVILPAIDQDELTAMLGPPQFTVYAGGQSHQQILRRHGSSLFVNPGSVGLSFDAYQPHDQQVRVDPFAAYAILTSGPAGVEFAFRRVAFDVSALLSVIATSGLPDAEETARLWGG